MKRITFLTGYYGSGKTELAVNIAIQKSLTTLVDLDVINPYFRSREVEELLNHYDVDVISSDVETRKFLDMPFVSGKIYSPLYDESKKVIYDLGGNDLGAKLLRQFDDYRDVDYDLLLVVNVFRTETDEPDKIIRLINRIEGTSGFKVTGLINNSNLLKDTSLGDLMKGQSIVESVSESLNIPIHYTSYWEKLKLENLSVSNETLKLNLYFRKDWF